MITDKLANAKLYYGLSERFEKAFHFLESTDLTKLEVGKHQIEGEEIFVLIQEYDTKSVENCKWESHKLYADIQYIFAGNEKMAYAPIAGLTDADDKTPAKDVINYKDANQTGDLIRYAAGTFGLFFPEDGHMPNISDGESSRNKKAVVKVLL